MLCKCKTRSDIKKKQQLKNDDKGSELGLSSSYQNDFLNYLELHAGPEYYIHYKISNTNIIIFNCLLFGPMLPLLYVTGLISLGIQYVVEKITLAYFYRKPPLFTDELTKSSIMIQHIAPILALMNTFWLFTNH